jgi:predicted transglutaminase-like cysteine proteinase
MDINAVLVSSLWPQEQKASITDLFPKPKADAIGTLLSDIQRVNDSFLQLKLGKLKLFNNDGSEAQSSVDYTPYLQLGSQKIRDLARSIVSPRDSDDVKAAKIRDWVEQNIEYADDLKTYKTDEYWALPTMTLNKGQGDCEDGAFLQASLMLNAGVDPDRVRVYGGFVSAGTNASTGGHAWLAYKREEDNEWVALDWCYFPNSEEINDRKTLEEDTKYMDDFFYVTATKTVETPYNNTLRLDTLPEGYRKALSPQPGQMFQALA